MYTLGCDPTRLYFVAETVPALAIRRLLVVFLFFVFVLLYRAPVVYGSSRLGVE